MPGGHTRQTEPAFNVLYPTGDGLARGNWVRGASREGCKTRVKCINRTTRRAPHWTKEGRLDRIRRVSMGLSVWRETSKKLTVCREKGKKLTVCRELFLFR